MASAEHYCSAHKQTTNHSDGKEEETHSVEFCFKKYQKIPTLY